MKKLLTILLSLGTLVGFGQGIQTVKIRRTVAPHDVLYPVQVVRNKITYPLNSSGQADLEYAASHGVLSLTGTCPNGTQFYLNPGTRPPLVPPCNSTLASVTSTIGMPARYTYSTAHGGALQVRASGSGNYTMSIRRADNAPMSLSNGDNPSLSANTNYPPGTASSTDGYTMDWTMWGVPQVPIVLTFTKAGIAQSRTFTTEITTTPQQLFVAANSSPPSSTTTTPASTTSPPSTDGFNYVPLASTTIPGNWEPTIESSKLILKLNLKSGSGASNGLAGGIRAITNKTNNRNEINLPQYGPGNKDDIGIPLWALDLGRGINECLYRGSYPFFFNGFVAAIGNNPNESGDENVISSLLNAFGQSGNTVYTEIVPNQWGMPGQRTGTIMRKWLTVENNVITCRYETIFNDNDGEPQERHNQEAPCLYANGQDYHLVFYDGNSPWTNDGVTDWQLPDGAGFGKTPGGHYVSENWIAAIGADGQGIGLIMETCASSIGQFDGKNGRQDGTDFAANYIGWNPNIIMDRNIRFRHRCEIVVGTVAEIRARAYNGPMRPAYRTPEFRFNKAGRQNWAFAKCQDAGHLDTRTSWAVTMQGDRAALKSPAGPWEASQMPKLYMRYRFQSTRSNPNLTFTWRKPRQKEGPTGGGELDGMRYTNGNFEVPEQMQRFNVIPDNAWHVAEVDMTGKSAWTGVVNEFQIGNYYTDAGIPSGEVLDIEWISANPTGPTFP